MKRVVFATLGCRLNQAESGSIQALLEESGGWTSVAEGEEADLVYVNTCTVTAQADAKSRQVIRRLAALYPGAPLVAGGCYVQRAPHEIASLPGVKLLVGVADRKHIASLVDEAMAGAIRHEISPLHEAGSFLEAPVPRSSDRTRGFVRVQEGCDESCTFCIVPKTRGASRSRSVIGVLQEVRALVAKGIREIVLTGANLGEWGMDTTGRRGLVDLLREVVDVPDLLRVRLSSLDPDAVTPEFLDLFEADRRLARHLHLPIQSASEPVRAAMKRRSTAAAFAEIVREVHRRVPGTSIGTDVLAGFPSETDDDFERTFELLSSLPISYLHAFSYSVRPGSTAEPLGDPISPDMKRRRTAALRRLSDEKAHRFRETQVGEVATVLLERAERAGIPRLVGYADNFVRVDLGEGARRFDVVRARLVEATPEGCRGQLVEAS